MKSVRALFIACDEALGRVACVVNNAGIIGGSIALADLEEDALLSTFATNLHGTIYCLQEAVERMRTDRGGGGGVIVNMSSLAAVLAATLALSGCIAGTVVRQRTWERDPSPFWVVMRDEGEGEGECTVVFDTVLIEGLEGGFSVSGFGPPISGCRNPPFRHANQVRPTVHLGGGVLKRLDLSLPKASRSGPAVIDEEDWVRPGESGPTASTFTMGLTGTRFGTSPFCPIVHVSVERLRLIHNAGAEHDVHVLVGEGTRKCAFQ